MRGLIRKVVALGICELLVFLPITGDSRSPSTSVPIKTTPLRDYLQKSYLELFELTPQLEFSADEIQNQRQALDKGKDLCVTRFKDHFKQYSKQIDTTQKTLKSKTGTISDAERKQMHCQIQNLELLKSEAQALSGQVIPTAYDNLGA